MIGANLLGLHHSTPIISCLEALAQWRQRLLNRQKAENTVKGYCIDVADALQAFARRDAQVVAVVGAREVEGWLDDLAGRGLKLRSQARKLCALRTFFAYCVQQRWCTANPCADIHIRFHAEQVIAPELPVLMAVIAKIPVGRKARWDDVRDRAILRLALDAALRVGGLQALNLPMAGERSTIDLERLVVTTVAKGGGSTAPIAINRTTADCVADWLAVRAPHAKADEQALFTSNRRRRMTRQGMHAMACRRGKAAGVADLHIHLFRHRRIGGMVETLGVKIASKHAGHAHESTTMNVYGAHADNVVRGIVRQRADLDVMAGAV